MKVMKYLYTENYKTLMKETEEDTNECKDISQSWVGHTYLQRSKENNFI